MRLNQHLAVAVACLLAIAAGTVFGDEGRKRPGSETYRLQELVIDVDPITGAPIPRLVNKASTPVPGRRGHFTMDSSKYKLDGQVLDLIRPDPNGKPVYNCLSHAKGINTQWVSPAGPVTMQNIMDDNRCVVVHQNVGTPAESVACANPPESTPCPRGKRLVWLVYSPFLPEAVPFTLPSDDRWDHAMRKQANGKWTSKNGQLGRWDGIADPVEFLNKHYPVPEGRVRDIRCACCR
jgi:hypothetical protein